MINQAIKLMLAVVVIEFLIVISVMFFPVVAKWYWVFQIVVFSLTYCFFVHLYFKKKEEELEIEMKRRKDRRKDAALKEIRGDL